MQPIPVFLPGESHGQRSLSGCRLYGCTELDMTEATELAFWDLKHFSVFFFFNFLIFNWTIIYNVVLASAKQQFESATSIHMSPASLTFHPPAHSISPL